LEISRTMATIIYKTADKIRTYGDQFLVGFWIFLVSNAKPWHFSHGIQVMITLASGSDLPCFEQSVRLGNGNIGKESPEEQLLQMQEAFSHTISKRKPKKAEALYQRPSICGKKFT